MAADGEQDNIPPWILPYVDVAGSREVASAVFVNAHVSLVLAGMTIRHIARTVKDPAIRTQLESAAGGFVSAAIDDCGSTGPHKPHQPGRIDLLQSAAQLGYLSVSVQSADLRKDLAVAARTLSERAMAATNK